MASDLAGGGVDAPGGGGQGGGFCDGAVACDELVSVGVAPGSSCCGGQESLAQGLGEGEVGEGLVEFFEAGDEESALGVLPVMAGGPGFRQSARLVRSEVLGHAFADLLPDGLVLEVAGAVAGGAVDPGSARKRM
jgi:hypothetical protein